MGTMNREFPCSTPITQRLDRYLLVARWGVILSAAAISRFEGFPGGSLAPIRPLWGVLIVGNLIFSVYIWQWKPISRRRILPLLSLDMLQVTLAIILTGGYRSAFYVLSLLLAAEIGLAFRWRTSVTSIISAGVWFSVVNILGQTNDLESYAAYITVSKFAVFLLVGLLVSALNELMHREIIACQQTVSIAKRLEALNNLFFRLGESHLNLPDTLDIVIESTRFLPQVHFAVVLLPAGRDVWSVAASNFESLGLEDEIRLPGWRPEQEVVLCGEDECPTVLAEWGAEIPDAHLAVLRLSVASEDEPGYLLVGCQADELLNEEAVSYLQSLAQEASLALRNARLYAQEKAQVERMQRFEALQAAFFAAISHELKTPLSVLKMLIPSLTQFSGLPSETQSEIIETITHNLNRLETLIRDLLESTRLEAGAVQLHFHTFKVRSRIQGVLAGVQPLAQAKEQKLIVDVTPPDLQIWADPARTDQILSNLLHNAIKFSPSRGHIQIEATSQDDGVQICVLDEGPGIPESDRAQIFDKFYVVKEQKALSGVGLGLFICRALVQLHKGHIWVENRPSGGSRFCFVLPYKSEVHHDGKSR